MELPSLEQVVKKKPPRSYRYENAYLCAVCSGHFKTKSSLKRHLHRTEHSVSTPVSDVVKASLPSEWKYTLCTDAGAKNSVFATVKLGITTLKELSQWMNSFMNLNNCKYIRRSTAKETTQSCTKIIAIYKCEHHMAANRTTLRKKKVKGTSCSSKIYCVIKPDHTIVKIHSIVHNHSLTSAEVVSFRKPTAEVERIFSEMFENGIGAGDALQHYKSHLQTQENPVTFTNRAKVPDYDWVQHFYHRTFKQKYRSSSSRQLLNNLMDFVHETNKKYPEPVSHFLKLDDDNFVIVIVTPFMKRMLSTACAAKVMFMDSCGSVDKFGVRVFLLMTKVKAGGLPLGIIVTTNDEFGSLEKSLKLFLTLVNDSSFGGRGIDGPINIITSDSTPEIRALKSVFPKSHHFLCVFHILRSFHRWLCKLKHKVNVAERIALYNVAREMVFAESENQLDLLHLNAVKNYENRPVGKYLTTLYNKRQKWALIYRNNPVLRGFNTNNICEHSLRILKENIFDRLKSQCLSKLVDYLANNFNNFYKEILIDCALGNNQSYNAVKKGQIPNLEKYTLQQVPDCKVIYAVRKRTSNVTYFVNTDIGTCTCYIGVSGNICKHQRALLNERSDMFDHLPPIHKSEPPKIDLYDLATGSNNFKSEGVIKLLQHPRITCVDSNEDVLCSNFKNNPNTTDESTENSPTDVATIIVPSDEAAIYRGISEIERLKINLIDIYEIMLQRPDYYLEGLLYINEELEKIKQTPPAILPALFSFNKPI